MDDTVCEPLYVVLLAGELTDFVGTSYRERQLEEYSPNSGRAVVGVCTGSLAAIAAIIGRSDADFLDLALEFVLVALRLGVEVSRRSDNIESASEPWAVAITKVGSESVLATIDAFNQSHMIPMHKTVYVSAQSAAGLTLSGPPSILKRFLEDSASMKDLPQRTLPIYGSFHAPHFPLPDVAAILGNSDLWNRNISSADRSSLVLSYSLDIGAHDTLRKLLSQVVTDILHTRLDFQFIVQRTGALAQNHSVRFVSVGPAHTGVLKRSLPIAEIERFGSPKLPSDQASIKNDYRDAIAIIGMACRTPGAQNVDELWKLLLEGRDMHQQVPPDRFDVKTHYDPTGKIPNTTITQWGCFDEHVAEFDLAMFKMSPREAMQTDPCHRLMLITGYEALESAGYYDPGGPRPKFGTFYGQAGDDYRQVNSGQNIDTNYITGGIRAFAPGRVSYYFGWEGPSMNIDTACSSSAVAINQACSSLRLGESDMALAGGVNLLTSSDFFAGLSRARFISTTGPCKTLDETADGYCRADGAGSVVLKRYEDALRDNDEILGVIRSIETSHAGTAISITHPEPDTQIALFQSILAKVGMDVRDIDHVEMHGTGTQAGDLAETESIAGLVEVSGGPQPGRQPLTIASVKPNVGHSEGASGVTSLIKALLMMKHRTNPRHIGIKTRINPKLPPLAELGIIPPLRHMPYTPRSDKRRIVVNNFNATGGITAMLVEEHVSNQSLGTDSRGDYPIVLSAANQKSLTKGITQLLAYTKTRRDLKLSHLSYTLTARRLHHNYGFACVVNSMDELVKQLTSATSSSAVGRNNKRGSLKSTVFVFTGQAVSYMGMAKVLFKTNDVFRNHLICSDTLCQTMGLPSFLEIIDHDGNEDDLTKLGPAKAHLALVALEVALAHLFGTWGVQPTMVMGHSLGEYSALCVSQALSLADTLYLVGKRAQLMETLCRPNEYAMIATSLPSKEACDYAAKLPGIQVSCLNGPSQTVLSGPKAAIDDCIVSLEGQKVKVKRLAVEYAFHSAQMDALLPEYKRIAAGISFRAPTVPFVSTYLGRTAHLDDINAEFLCQQTRQPVLFMEAVESISRVEGDDSVLWIELGPAAACSQLVSLITNTTNTVAALHPSKADWRTISGVLTKHYMSRGNVGWREFHMQYLANLRLVETPSYPFDMTRHWMQYEGDWSITKNRGSSQKALAATSAVSLRSSTLQWLQSMSESLGLRTLVFSSDLKVVQSPDSAHSFVVDGNTFPASAVYLDMFMTAALEFWARSDRESSCPGIEIVAFERHDTLLPDGHVDGTVTVIATEHVSDKSLVEISITSTPNNDSGGVKCSLAKCKAIFGDTNAWTGEAEMTGFLYQSRMDLLEMFSRSVPIASIPGAHKQLPSIPKGSTGLQSIQSVSLASGTLEAVARVAFPASEDHYHCNPQFFTALLQLPKLALSRDGIVNGWHRLRIFCTPSPDAQYRSHVRMDPQTDDPRSMTGSIHVFDMENRPVAEITGIKYLPVDSGDARQPALPTDIPRLRAVHLETQATTMVNSLSNSVKANTPVYPGPASLASTPDSASSPDSPISISMQAPFSNVVDEVAVQVSSPRLDASKAVDVNLVLSVLASELGVSLDLGNEHEPLEDMGVDSIMQMTLLAKMQESVSVKLPGNLLVERNSFAKLKTFFEDGA